MEHIPLSFPAAIVRDHFFQGFVHNCLNVRTLTCKLVFKQFTPFKDNTAVLGYRQRSLD